MKTVFVRSPYNYDVLKASDESGVDCSVEPSLTKQSFREECDINTIVRRFGLTGELPQGVPQVVQGDFTEVFDFQSAMNLVVLARESFDAMPAHVRAEFKNDPQAFLEFTSKEENRGRAVELGLLRPEATEAFKAKAAADRAGEIRKAAEALLRDRSKAGEDISKEEKGTVST